MINTINRKFKKTGLKFVYYRNRINPYLHINLFIVEFIINFDYKIKYNQNKYGFNLINDKLMLYWKLKEKIYHFPWKYKLYKVFILNKNRNWEEEDKNNSKHHFKSDWNGYLHKERHTYKNYKKNGYIQQVKCDVVIIKKVYRRLKLKKYEKSEQLMVIKFDKPIGENKDIIGYSYIMNENDTIKSALNRMQNEKRL